MKISKQLLAILITSSIGLVSCGGGVKSAPSLVGTHWQLSSVNGSTLSKRLSKRITLNFHPKRASGSAGCNRYFSNYKLSGSNSVSFRGIGSTKMLCKPRFMKAERKFLSALRNANSYRLSNGALFIKGTGRVGVLKFVRP